MITSRSLINQYPPSSGEKPTNVQRRALMGGALAALLASSGRLMADNEGTPNDPFILLLQGIYQPVPIGKGPLDNLGLTTVNLSDGSYSKTQIYPIFGVDGANDQKKAIGSFYVQFAGSLCAYDLPGGSIAMQFNSGPVISSVGFNTFVPFPDGHGGNFLEGTFELVILEATEFIELLKAVTTTWSIDCINWLTVNSMNSASAISASISSHNWGTMGIED
jgi:hypothetical protein